jgi:adenylyltransferase/sulfurtransferase
MSAAIPASNCCVPESKNEVRMTINIPTPLQAYAAGSGCSTVEAGTVAEALERLTDMHPELRKHLFTPEGKVRSFVNLYLNDEDVRYLPAGEATVVTDEDTLSIIPSIAGGA